MRHPAFVCSVDTGGIAHVFTPLAVGARCACGRAVAALSDDERRLEVRRVDPWPAPARSPAVAVISPAEAQARDREDLLIHGGVAIARARTLRAHVVEERAARRAQRDRRGPV